MLCHGNRECLRRFVAFSIFGRVQWLNVDEKMRLDRSDEKDPQWIVILSPNQLPPHARSRPLGQASVCSGEEKRQRFSVRTLGSESMNHIMQEH